MNPYQPQPQYPPPYPHQPLPKTNGGKITGLIIGALLILARFIVPSLPVYRGHTFDQAHAVCSGALGAFISAFSHQAARDCSTINTIYTAANFVTAAAVILVLACGVLLLVNRRTA